MRATARAIQCLGAYELSVKMLRSETHATDANRARSGVSEVILRVAARYIVLIASLLAGVAAQGQAPPPSATGPSANTEAQRLLELKRLDLALKDARAKRDRAKLLYDQGLGPQAQYEAAEITYRQAQVDFQQAFLRLFAEAPRLDIVSAIKFQRPDGSKYVRVTEKNTSG